MSNNIILTTESNPIDLPVEERLEIITAECVFGINIFRDLFADVRNIFGGRSDSSQKVLRDARKKCLSELQLEAHSIGADAVIGINLDYNEFSGGNKSMLFLVASGTAVKLKNKDLSSQANQEIKKENIYESSVDSSRQELLDKKQELLDKKLQQRNKLIN
jgi:uncharacterized protein YbjQ (UPF0145 family)